MISIFDIIKAIVKICINVLDNIHIVHVAYNYHLLRHGCSVVCAYFQVLGLGLFLFRSFWVSH